MSVYVIIPFRTTDYAWWKEIFDKFAESRLGWGALAYVIYRGLDDPEAITVVHEFADRIGHGHGVPLSEARSTWLEDRRNPTTPTLARPARGVDRLHHGA